MERETAGCLLLGKNSTTSVNLLLSLNYHDFIINRSTAACSILLYIQGTQGILQVLMNEQGMKKHCYFVFSYWLLPRDLNAHSLAITSGQILFIYFLYRKKRCHEITDVCFDSETGAL